MPGGYRTVSRKSIVFEKIVEHIVMNLMKRNKRLNENLIASLAREHASGYLHRSDHLGKTNLTPKDIDDLENKIYKVAL